MKLKHFLKTLIIFAFALSSCKDNTPSSDVVETNNDWTVNYLFNYEGNDSTFKSVEVSDDTLVSKPTDPTREGYLFDNWYKDSYCKIPFDFSTDKITADTSIYAGWIKKQSYSILWDQVDGVTYLSTSNDNLPTSAYTNDEVSFKLEVDTQNYLGEAVVKVNNEVVSATNDIFNFVVSSNMVITVEGIEPLVSNYTITFTLPSGWTPEAVNPRVYYWGSETLSDSLFTCGATSNMELLEGKTYYIEIDTSITIEGLIVIFDQGSEVKQSIDINPSVLTKAGTYEIVVNDWANWPQNSSGVYCFVAELVAK